MKSSIASLNLCWWMKWLGFVLTTQTPILVERQEQKKTMCFTNFIKPHPCSPVGVGCAAHIVHNAVLSAVDRLPCDTESFVKVFGYFHIYTVQTEELKDFRDWACLSSRDKQNSLAFTGASCWERPEALPRRSQDKAPNSILKFLEDQVYEAWFWFIHNQLTLFNDTIKRLEKEKNSPIHFAMHSSSLLEKLMERKAALFIVLKPSFNALSCNLTCKTTFKQTWWRTYSIATVHGITNCLIKYYFYILGKKSSD